MNSRCATAGMDAAKTERRIRRNTRIAAYPWPRGSIANLRMKKNNLGAVPIEAAYISALCARAERDVPGWPQVALLKYLSSWSWLSQVSQWGKLFTKTF